MYDAIRAAIAAIFYVVLVWLSVRFFPGLPVLFLAALVGLPILFGALLRTWWWIVLCPLAVTLVIWYTRSHGPIPFSVDPTNPLVDGLAAGSAAFFPALIGAYLGSVRK